MLETVSGLLVARNSVRRTLEALERAAPDSPRSEAVVDAAVVLPGWPEHLPSLRLLTLNQVQPALGKIGLRSAAFRKRSCLFLSYLQRTCPWLSGGKK